MRRYSFCKLSTPSFDIFSATFSGGYYLESWGWVVWQARPGPNQEWACCVRIAKAAGWLCRWQSFRNHEVSGFQIGERAGPWWAHIKNQVTWTESVFEQRTLSESHWGRCGLCNMCWSENLSVFGEGPLALSYVCAKFLVLSRGKRAQKHTFRC